MDQLICASLSHTHYWYGVGMLKLLLYRLYGPAKAAHVQSMIYTKCGQIATIIIMNNSSKTINILNKERRSNNNVDRAIEVSI